MRVVFDTNILISAIFWRGTPYKIFNKALEKRFFLYSSPDILKELEEKLRLKFSFPINKLQDYIKILLEYGTIINPSVKLDIIKDDPDDNKILECAVSCKADYIVSGDKHLLNLIKYNDIKIISAKEFYNLI